MSNTYIVVRNEDIVAASDNVTMAKADAERESADFAPNKVYVYKLVGEVAVPSAPQWRVDPLAPKQEAPFLACRSND